MMMERRASLLYGRQRMRQNGGGAQDIRAAACIADDVCVTLVDAELGVHADRRSRSVYSVMKEGTARRT